MKYGVVIVIYHSFEMIIRYVKEELPKLGDDFVAVIVNNDSTSCNCQRLAEACGVNYIENFEKLNNTPTGKLFLIGHNDNLGYAKGNNLGTKFLMKFWQPKYLLFSNDDIEIKSNNILDCLSNVIEESDSIKMVGPRVIGLDGSDRSPKNRLITIYRQIGWNFLFFLRRKPKEIIFKSENNPSISKCYWVSGCFFLIETISFIKCNMFDERTFLYYEEPILVEKLKQFNYTCAYNSTVMVLHYVGATTKKNFKHNNFLLESSCIYYRYYLHNSALLIYILKLSNVFNRIIKSFINIR